MYLQQYLTTQISANAFQLLVLVNSFHKLRRQSLMYFLPPSTSLCWRDPAEMRLLWLVLVDFAYRGPGFVREEDTRRKMEMPRDGEHNHFPAPHTTDWTQPFVSGQKWRLVENPVLLHFYNQAARLATNGFDTTSRCLHLPPVPETNPEILQSTFINKQKQK